MVKRLVSRVAKRLARLLQDNGAKWDEVLKILRHYGLEIREPKGGSHWVVLHPSRKDTFPISVPVHNNRVKAVYIKKVIALLGEVISDED